MIESLSDQLKQSEHILMHILGSSLMTRKLSGLNINQNHVARAVRTLSPLSFSMY